MEIKKIEWKEDDSELYFNSHVCSFHIYKTKSGTWNLIEKSFRHTQDITNYKDLESAKEAAELAWRDLAGSILKQVISE